MEKPAPVDYPVHPLIRRRWSPSAFSDKPVDPEILRSLFEAVRWAPSSFNEQPWFFIVATRDDSVAFERLLACLTPGNQKWAKRAPVLILSAAKMNFEHNGKPNRHAFHDVGLAVENLVLQATSMDLFVHQMAGFDREKARETYQIPEGFEPVAAIAVGYGGEPEDLPEDLRGRELAERKRRLTDSFVFSGRWGVTSPIVKT